MTTIAYPPGWTLRGAAVLASMQPERRPAPAPRPSPSQPAPADDHGPLTSLRFYVVALLCATVGAVAVALAYDGERLVIGLAGAAIIWILALSGVVGAAAIQGGEEGDR